MYFCRKLPSVFLRKSDRMQPVKKEKVYTYDRDIICLPQSYVGKDESISIPRGAPTRNYLAKHGLIGKIRLSSEMMEEEIFKEIYSVFADAMNGNPRFDFSILQQAGGTSKSLVIPALSSSYTWTASAVAGRNSKVPIYILAKEELKVWSV